MVDRYLSLKYLSMVQRSVLVRLPSELLFKIFKYIERSDISNILPVSKYIKAAFLQSQWLRNQINKELGNYNPRYFPNIDWTRIYVILNRAYIIDSTISIILKTGWKTSGIPGVIEGASGYLTDGEHVVSGISNTSLLIMNRATVEFLVISPKQLRYAGWPSKIRSAAYHSDLLLVVGLTSTSGFKTLCCTTIRLYKVTTESFKDLEIPTIISETCTAVCINADYFCLASASAVSGSNIYIYSRATYDLVRQKEPPEIYKKLWLDDVTSTIILRGTVLVAQGSKRVYCWNIGSNIIDQISHYKSIPPYGELCLGSNTLELSIKFNYLVEIYDTLSGTKRASYSSIWAPYRSADFYCPQIRTDSSNHLIVQYQLYHQQNNITYVPELWILNTSSHKVANIPETSFSPKLGRFLDINVESADILCIFEKGFAVRHIRGIGFEVMTHMQAIKDIRKSNSCSRKFSVTDAYLKPFTP
ncbi:uncharacterized protein RAG0_02965 [Rhynchosporium agropyri]|uniref:F-box domain-containing protein n=1 Tax=Rhynchosporium agropyri TaxID=914238 RepID=A0A1E1K365_9HELO|nr:uncharacterized protein RAG0_02965 [Rhynchosporium agropyri]